MLWLNFLRHLIKVAPGYENMIEIEKNPVARFYGLPRERSHILCIFALFPYIKKSVTHISGLVGDRKLQNPLFYRESQHFYCKFSFWASMGYPLSPKQPIFLSFYGVFSPFCSTFDQFYKKLVSRGHSKWKFAIEMLRFPIKWGVLQLPITYQSRDMSNGLFSIGK